MDATAFLDGPNQTGEAQRGALQRAWAEADGNVSKLSKLLGVSRPTAYKLLREHGLKE